MNKLVIVAKNSQTYFVKRLIEEVGEGVVIFNPWSDFLIPEAENYIVRTTGVYGSDLDLLMLKTLPTEKIINSLNSLQLFRSKLTQYIWFEENNYLVPPWINLKGIDLLTVEKFFRLYPKALVKPNVGQGGWGIEVMTWESFKPWWKKKKGVDEDYLLQVLVEEGVEYRYFFIKDHFSTTLTRSNRSGIPANFTQNGEARLASLPEDLNQLCSRISDKSGAYYGAIDFIVKNNQLYLLELNTVPGIEQLENISGQNIIRYLLNAKFFCQTF